MHAIKMHAIPVFHNWKPWMNREIYSRVRSKTVVFKSNESEQFKKCMYNGHKAIKDARRKFWTKLLIQHIHTFIKNGVIYPHIHQIWCHISTHSSNMVSYISNIHHTKVEQFHWQQHILPQRVFEWQVGGMISSTLIALDTPVPIVTVTDVRLAFLRVNPQKGTGPVGVIGHDPKRI